MRQIRASVWSVLVFALWACAAGDARGEPYIRHSLLSGRRDIEVNLRLSTGYGFGYHDIYYHPVAVGPGVQMLFPVLQNGIIPRLNNAFYIGFFLDLLYVPYAAARYQDSGFFSFLVGPMLQWRLYVIPRLSVFGNIGLGLWPWFAGDPYGHRLLLWPIIEGGGNWHFSRRVALTFSLGYPAARIGLSFGF